jgi:hypothetical protein
MKDCYYDLGLHFILLDDSSQSYILKLRDRDGLMLFLDGEGSQLGNLMNHFLGRAEAKGFACFV